MVADKVVTLVEERGIMEEAAVSEGGMVKTPTPPSKTGRKSKRRSELLIRGRSE